MPATFTHSPAETERKEPGIGGKPPLDRRPTGGGGGGGDDDRQNERRGPRELLHKIRFSVFAILAADMMFFAILVALFFARQAGTHMDPRTHEQIGDWHPILLPPILFLNTALLLLSSLTIEIARHSIFREIDVLEEWLGLGHPALQRTVPWMIATLGLGLAFIGGQIMAWKQLIGQGFAFNHSSTPASYFFYIITGLHAAHLIVGVISLAVILIIIRNLKRIELRQIAVDANAWYWHAMGLAWLILFAVLVVGQ